MLKLGLTGCVGVPTSGKTAAQPMFGRPMRRRGRIATAKCILLSDREEGVEQREISRSTRAVGGRHLARVGAGCQWEKSVADEMLTRSGQVESGGEGDLLDYDDRRRGCCPLGASKRYAARSVHQQPAEWEWGLATKQRHLLVAEGLIVVPKSGRIQR